MLSTVKRMTDFPRRGRLWGKQSLTLRTSDEDPRYGTIWGNVDEIVWLLAAGVAGIFVVRQCLSEITISFRAVDEEDCFVWVGWT
jgi:hypothetical protein